jgi:hypothetical protein
MNHKCPCPNKKCEVHGNCKVCMNEHHGTTMYCKLPPWRQRLNIVICKILRQS